ncbi:hypothetical protein PAXRUDRAFT_128535 [Paxillus rubicundulus Ve08.2h10]|uniref:Uncharacterized protein n=1 Tax=Paxillus rubicundulus Ve08.2h10 TaxID=930991 RepID=A0A0D0EDE4_9AGAM|nr:hypothetical protein PAXRUDRAFT_128535 [Paxillus rubicundulus Ve08.2h10]
MSPHAAHSPSHPRIRYIQRTEADFAPPGRRVRTSELFPVVATHSRQRGRRWEELDRRNATPQYRFGLEGSTMWHDEVDEIWTMAHREEERLFREDVERSLSDHQQRARERKERERRVPFDGRQYPAYGSVCSVPLRSPVAWPASPNDSTQFHTPAKSRIGVHRMTSRFQHLPAELHALYVFPIGYPQPAGPWPEPERHRPVDRSRMVVPPPTPLDPMPKPPKFSMLARLNPFNRLRTTSMSITFPNNSASLHAPMERPARLRCNSTTCRV